MHLSLSFENCLFTLENVGTTLWNKDCSINAILEAVHIKRKYKKIILSPTTAEEFADVIKTFNLNKAIGPNSITVIILKEKKEMSEALSTLINLSFNAGNFPNCLILAKVKLVYKKRD